MGRNLKRCQYHFDGDRIESLKVTKYRDTRGVGLDEYNKVFDVIDTTCAKGKRDYALFLLLWANVLRRGEVAKLRVGDFDDHENTLTVYGKGKGNDSTRIDLNPFVAEAIAEKLHQLGQISQVLCVTHQPLVAAMADRHFRVDKQVITESTSHQKNNGHSEQRTVVRVTSLDNLTKRREELAQLAGGKSAQEAIAFAESLLTQAANHRRQS